MSRTILALLLASFISVNCGKKDSAELKNIKPKDNTQTKQNQTQSSQTAAGNSFAVKSVGSTEGKNNMVDFSWVENGLEKKLSDYKGKVILVNFWATWCPPCRKELPALSQISNELKGKDFVLIGVSVDDNQQVLDNFLKANSLSYTVVHEPNELLAKYMSAADQNQNVVPQSYILDKNGKLVETILGSRSKEDFLSLINKHL
jgi:thiol-disulfide isomerase/thioredoxin